jgi:tRNA U34 5-methylaminomethyl-2-thiouridine-forming methyltransferase MnmC
MHNLKGALSETVYIYGLPLTYLSEWQVPEPSVLSLGLGLGYNELLVTAHFLKNRVQQWRLISYESVSWLRNQFIAWLADQPPEDPTLAATYSRIVELVAAKIGELKSVEIKNLLKQQWQSGSWRIESEFTPATIVPFKCHAILYDAFSSHTNPELWGQASLESFLENAAAIPCAFATYAATGDLNRALRAKGFNVQKVKGFGGKRESTFAIR